MNGPPAGTPAIVDVFADPLAGGGVHFRHEWRWHSGHAGGKGRIDIPKRAAVDPATPIHFNLRDKTGRGLKFSDDGLGAIWVDRTGCPQSQSDDPEIPPAQIKSTPKLLKLLNENSEECTLHYRLRFTDRAGKPESYDPDIKNGGKARW